jgi:anti-sigma factor RsiW
MIDPHTFENVADHPSSEEIADYLNGRLSSELRSTLESHLAECRTCRQQVVSARRLLDTYRLRRPFLWAAPALAAAVLALVLFAPRKPWDAPDEEVLRGRQPGTADVTPQIGIVAPRDGDSVSVGAVRFVWRSQAGQPLYRVTVTEGAGAVWSTSTTDTSAAVPDSVLLDRSRTYRWYVDAAGADGRSLTSGVQRFVVKP